MDKIIAKKTPFSKLLPIRVENEKHDQIVTPQSDSAIELVKGAAYTLAPIPQLAKPFIYSCLLPPSR